MRSVVTAVEGSIYSHTTMTYDIRKQAAHYYDLNDGPDDLEFYRERIPDPEASVLELGCGTGRVLLPMARDCGFIHGVDLSEAMIAICLEKLERAELSASRVRVEVADITQLRLARTFDLVMAPFRVLQNLETDAEVGAFFGTIRSHLAPGGTAIITVFQPNRDAEEMAQEWVGTEEYACWQREVDGEVITCHGLNRRMDAEKKILYPELIYRRRRAADVVEEVVLKLVMRYYYPAELEHLVRAHGFDIVNRWGGYAGEPYGEGSELILEFRARS